jgi:hypothetical protein
MRSAHDPQTSGQAWKHLWLALGLALVLPGLAAAQPFGGWLTLPGYPTSSYIAIPHSEALNPTTGFTFEAWVKVRDAHHGNQCSSIAGKNWMKAWWIGVCNQTLRSYIKGYLLPDNLDLSGGFISPSAWTHIAVTYDGAVRKHYINGALAASRAETGPLTTSTDEVEIGSDVGFHFSAAGDIDEVHLWSVARTQEQIQQDAAGPITGPVQGLIAVWSFNGNARDQVSVNNGTVNGTLTFSAPAPPDGPWLTTHQIPGFQFKVRVTGTSAIAGVKESCIPETLCVSASVPGRTEVLVRIVGPKPNGYLWPDVVKLTTSQVEVWVDQLSTGTIKYYILPGPWPGLDDLPGLYDRTGFQP